MVNKYTIRGTINKNALTLLFMNHPFSSFINDFISFLLKTYSLDNSVTSSIIFDYNLEQKRKDFGDLSCNAPLVLGKILKKSPFLLAQELSSLFFHPDCIAVQAHPAGFLNFFQIFEPRNKLQVRINFTHIIMVI